MTDTTPSPTSPATEPTAPGPDSFAVKLKAAREAAGLSKIKAGALFKVSALTVANWENERTKPTPQKQAAVLRKLREAVKPVAVIGVDPSYDRDQTTIVAGVQLGDKTVFVGDDGFTENEGEAKRFTDFDEAEAALQTAATPEELAHDPYEPIAGELSPDLTVRVELDTPATLPETPVGNVHTSQDGVIRRRLADDDEREGAELIDGRKWFTVGFAPPHPRAKPTIKAVSMEAQPAPHPATQERSEPRVHTETTPEPQKPAESTPVATVAGQRNWAFWNT